MKKQTVIRILAICLIMMLSFAGCASKENETSEKNEVLPVTLKLATSVYVEAPHRKAIDALVAAYNEKNPNVKVEIYGAGWDNFWDNLTTEILAGNEADIVQVYPDSIARYNVLRSEGVFTDLSPYMEGTNLAEKLVGQKECDLDGETLALSSYAWGTTGIFYRKSILEEAGINPESIKTQEDFREACIAMTSDTKVGMGVVCSSHSFVVDEWARLIARPVSKGLYFKNGESGPYVAENVNINSTENVWAAKWWQDLISVDKAVKLVPDKKDARELFWNGNAAFCMDGPWFIGMIEERDANLLEDIGLMPQFDILYNGETYKPNPMLYPLVNMISKDSQYVDEAWDFLEWTASEEAQKIIEVCGMIPSNTDYSTSEEYISTHELASRFVTFMDENYTTLVSNPSIPQTGEITQVMIDSTQAIFSEKKEDVQTVMDEAQKKVEEIMNK